NIDEQKKVDKDFFEFIASLEEIEASLTTNGKRINKKESIMKTSDAFNNGLLNTLISKQQIIIEGINDIKAKLVDNDKKLDQSLSISNNNVEKVTINKRKLEMGEVNSIVQDVFDILMILYIAFIITATTTTTTTGKKIRRTPTTGHRLNGKSLSSKKKKIPLSSLSTLPPPLPPLPSPATSLTFQKVD
ncbi:3996_t:CDS:2, partial [Entrophospora sp. SA101]